MTPVEVAALLERWAPVWNRRVHGTELEVWQQRLTRHDRTAVEDAFGDLLDAGNNRPLLGDVLGRLNAVEPQRPAPYRPHDDWQGPTDRGRQMIAAAKAEVRAAYRWENFRRDGAEIEVDA